MPTHATEERSGHLRTTIQLQKGDRVSLCRCMESCEFPFCDGTHKGLPTKAGPVIVEIVIPEEEKPGQ